MSGTDTAFPQAIYEPYTITTFAGTSGRIGSADNVGVGMPLLEDPRGVALDSLGNIYIADTSLQVIRKRTPDGTLSILAGSEGIFGGNDGIGAAARFDQPEGLTADNVGNVYVADLLNYTIRKITPSGVVTTVAGLARAWGFVDGTGSNARFNMPADLAVDSSGNIFVVDFDNHAIRKITPSGVVTTFAGSGQPGSEDGVGTLARFSYPTGITVDASDNLYVADFGNNSIRKITQGAVVTTLAGSSGNRGYVDGVGSAARFYYPNGICADTAGNLYVSEFGNSLIRKIAPGAVVTTLAGSVGVSNYADGIGSAAIFNSPSDLVADNQGNLYIAEAGNDCIRKVVIAEAAVSRLIGFPAVFYNQAQVVEDQIGNIYVADAGNDTIRKITSDGVVITFAGTAGNRGSSDGIGGAASFYGPGGLAIYNDNIFVSDSANHTIRKITPDRTVTTFAGLAGSSGDVDGVGNEARFYYPGALTTDANGNIYMGSHYTVRKITQNGMVTTVAGMAGVSGYVNGMGSAARFSGPAGLAVDRNGNIYVTRQLYYSQDYARRNGEYARGCI